MGSRFFKSRTTAIIVVDYDPPDTSTYRGVYVNDTRNQKRYFFEGQGVVDDYANAMEYARELGVDEIVLHEDCGRFAMDSQRRDSDYEYAFDINWNLVPKVYYDVY